MPDSLMLPLQTRVAMLEPSSLDAEKRTIEVVWSTGAQVRRSSWADGPYIEELSMDPTHVHLERLNDGAPFLKVHDRFDLDAVIGAVVPGSARIENGRGIATLLLDDAPETAGIVGKIAKGILRAVSIGYQVARYEVTKRDGQPDLWRAVDWTPFEISAVPVGADPAAGFRSGAGEAPCEIVSRAQAAHSLTQEDPMPETPSAAGEARPAVAQPPAPPSLPPEAARTREVPPAEAPVAAPPAAAPVSSDRARAADAPDPAEAVRAALQMERARIAGIQLTARKLGSPAAVVERMIADGIPLEAARERLLTEAADRDEATRTFAQVSTPLGGRDEVATRRAAVEAALLHRFDPLRYKLSDAAREWRGYSLLELARAFLGQDGHSARGLSRDEIATRSLHSTSDFPHILAAVTNKTLRDAYEQAPRTFPAIARRATAADFKNIHRLQLGEAPQLEKVNESGEFKRGTIGEAKESYRVETYGKVIAITRQVIINDDLDAFTRVPALFGAAAANLESDVVWSIVTANPAMHDGNALFHANHKNLAGAGGALDVANLGKARSAMARQVGLDGKTILNIRPAFLVVPSTLELTAEQLIAQNLVPAKSGDVVPASIRSLGVIAEPRLDPASGAVPWYLFASPAAIDTIEYAYLEGQEGVYIETRMGFDVDGVEVKARLDFGAKAIDWRGLYKNPGV